MSEEIPPYLPASRRSKQAAEIPELARLPERSAAAVKQSWLDVVETAQRTPVVMTRHERPHAVLLSVEQYLELVRTASQAESPLDALKRRFDERLDVLSRPDAASRLADASIAAPGDIARLAELPLLAG